MEEQTKKEIEEIELIIGKILRIGVLTAAAVLIVGLALLLVTGQSGYPEGMHPTAPVAILKGVAALKPDAIIMLGLFLLILTQVLRVVVSIYAFMKERDYLYVGITTGVLAILVVSMIIGYAGR